MVKATITSQVPRVIVALTERVSATQESVKMTKITATQLVWLRDVAHDKGTVFVVTETPEKQTEVDPSTAAAWLRRGWAVEGSKAKAKAAGEGA